MLKGINLAAQKNHSGDPMSAPYCDVCVFCDARDACSACDQEWCWPYDLT